jgi:coproporphyrinogen III oxidase-like Fe-S oxidoreductase
MNPVDSSTYIEALDSGRPAWERAFAYSLDDLRVFHLTRRLAALEIDRADYCSIFHSDSVSDFRPEFEALEEEGLVSLSGRLIEPTPTGMFYADSIAALLAWNTIRKKRSGGEWAHTMDDHFVNDNRGGHM